MSFELPKANGLQKERLNEFSTVKKTIAIMSGKGGVGKSSVTGLLAASLADEGYQVGILDADITGPSMPKVLGLSGKKSAYGKGGILPVTTKKGIKVMSVNLVIENEEDPVIWRAPIITQAIKQFYTEVEWGTLDYLLIDMPPGTGDVPLTVMQSIHVDQLVVVSSPQDLVQLIVKKSVNMAKKLQVPLAGIVENMSYFKCPDTGKIYHIFGEDKVKTVAENMNLPLIGQIPIDPRLASLSDTGKIEEYTTDNEEFSHLFGDKIKKAII